jgi:hypothetical protein
MNRISNQKLGGEPNGKMVVVTAGVQGQASVHDAFPGQKESVGVFALRTHLSDPKILDSGVGVIHTGS